ncbi:hypothetical protein MCHI_003149 [Candidatus Magnetoovum chiemensis]|nr:hypothetical protein MCHI_003149 [Candidatus Magnetoovum chiemensis]
MAADINKIKAFIKKRQRDVTEIQGEITKGDYPSIQMTGQMMQKNGANLGLDKFVEFGKEFDIAAGLKDSGKLKEIAVRFAAYVDEADKQYS